MACNLTTGRSTACFDTIAGVKAVYFADFDTLGAITYDLDGSTITTFAGLPEFFEFNCKGSASTFVETITKDINNGTSFYSQAATLQLGKLSKPMHAELKLLVYGSPHVIIRDYNDNYFVMGLENGADITSGTVDRGAARGDLSGYVLNLVAEEKAPANFLAVDIPTTTATISAVKETP